MTTPRVTVPVEPTEKMLKAGAAHMRVDALHTPKSIYRAMLSAAPAPEGRAVLDAQSVTLEWHKIETTALEHWRAEFGDYAAHVVLGHDNVWSYRINNSGHLGFASVDEAKSQALAALRKRLSARLSEARATVALYDAALATREEAPTEAGELASQIAILRKAANSPTPDEDGGLTPESALKSAQAWRTIASNVVAAFDRAHPQAREDAQPAALPLEDAPRDGTMLRLRVRYEVTNQDEAWTPLEDSEESWTIGFNNFDNTGDDRWQFVGWDWSQDHLLEATGGAVIGWLPFHTHPAPDALRVAREALEKAVWSLSSFGQLAQDDDGGNTEGLDDEVVVRMTFPDPEFGGKKTLLGELFIRAFRKARATTDELRQALAALQAEQGAT